jgi:uncharacterized membrane protein SpoIIM required for sporulation
MDLDRFLALNSPAWTRLEELCVTAGAGRATAAEIDELVELYQRIGAQLAYARRSVRDPAVHQRLTTVLSQASATVYGTRKASVRSLRRFVVETFPAAVWSARKFLLIAALFTFLPAIALGVWMNTSDHALRASAPETVRQAYVDSEFEDYYSSEPAGQFATRVFVNNVQVSIIAFAAGILGCVITAALLAYNGLNVGFAAGLFIHGGRAAKFFGLILPHGLLELSAVIVAGAAGLRLGWTLIAPGDRRRADALAAEGRRSISIVIGLIVAFGVAGTIEGFVTGSSLATALRVTIGVSVFLAFWMYVIVLGRAAEQAEARRLAEAPAPWWAGVTAS